MYPEEYSGSPYQNSGKRNYRLWLVIALSIIVIIVGIVITLFGRSSQISLPDYKLSKTNLNKDENFAYLQGNKLYSYNGLAFYETDITNGKITILSDGLRLPTPSSIHWAGARGALLTFKSSFSRTPVDQFLQSNGAVVDDSTPSYIWYLDFASGSLKLVNILGYQSDNDVLYSESEQGFYYVPSVPTKTSVNSTPLNFYNIATSKDQIAAPSLGVNNIASLSKCSAAEVLCIIGTPDNASSAQLYGLSKKHTVTNIYQSAGALYATSSDHLFITFAPQAAAVKDTEPGGDTTADNTPQDASVYNTDTKAATPLKAKLTGPEISGNFMNDGKFYVFDSNPYDPAQTPQQKEAPPVTVIGGELDNSSVKSAVVPLKMSDGSTSSDPVVGVSGFGNNDMALVQTAGNDQFLFGSQPNALPAMQSSQDVTNAVNSCLKSSGQPGPSQYDDKTHTFRIFVNDDANFFQNIKVLSDCIAKQGAKTLIGYNYRFDGVSPTNGRITTD